jgi:hypothetical protein
MSIEVKLGNVNNSLIGKPVTSNGKVIGKVISIEDNGVAILAVEDASADTVMIFEGLDISMGIKNAK